MPTWLSSILSILVSLLPTVPWADFLPANISQIVAQIAAQITALYNELFNPPSSTSTSPAQPSA